MKPRAVLARLLAGVVTNVTFSDAQKLLVALGFDELRVRGSHHVYGRPGLPEQLNKPARVIPQRATHSIADAALVQAAVLGDKAAFVQLINAHRASAEGLCRRLLRNSESSRDAVQEAMVVAWLSLDRLLHPDRFGAWFCGIALNKARQILRATLTEERLARSVADELALSSPEELVESEELRTRIRAAIGGLPRGQREAVYLFYLTGLTHREAAAELDISVNAVKARLHQARSNHGRVLIDLQEAPVTTAPSTGYVAVRIADVRMSKPDTSPRFGLVLLETADGEGHLPIFVGSPEANLLALGLESAEMPRPMTYQFAARLLDACAAQVIEIRITSLVEQTYLATAILQTPSGPAEVDARPSDALNLAVLVQAPIAVESSMLRKRDALVELGSAEQRDQLGDLLDRTEIVQEIRDRQEQAKQFFDQLCQRPAGGEPPAPPS
jgi:RNA polymerase sigma factor (sigma-70 family)